MTELSFLIPFRDVDGTRTAAMEWVVAHWRSRYPDAEFILAADDGIDPFNKSMAVNAAFARSAGEVLVILDADTMVPAAAFEQALSMIESGRAPWVVPANQAWRLKREPTLAILRRDPAAGLPGVTPDDVEQSSHVVGFCHVLPRAAMLVVGGMDERFRGWGGEDSAFVAAVDTLWGTHHKLRARLISLWHERPRDHEGNRVWIGQESRVANNRTWRQYSHARGDIPRLLATLRLPGGPLAGEVRWYSRGHGTGENHVTRVIFTCKRHPGLLARIDGRSFKFVGGRLVVNEDDARLLAQFAADRPLYDITSAGIGDAPPRMSDEGVDRSPELDAAPAKQRTTKAQLRSALRAIGEPTSGTKAQLAVRLAAAYGEPT